MRLFIALNLPDHVRNALHAATAPLRAIASSARWTGAKKLHLTLKFLGEREQTFVDSLIPAIDTVASRNAPVELRLDRVGAFPAAGRPRVVWIGIATSPALDALYRDIDAACATLGVEREARPFHPHVTLARIGPRVPRRDVQALLTAGEPAGTRVTVLVRTLDLMQSVSGRYVPLHRAALAS